MPIDLDKINPEFNVQLGVTIGFPVIRFNFSRLPDAEVVAEFRKLKEHPFVRFIINSDRAFKSGLIELIPTVNVLDVAEAIAVCLENDHGLKVERVVSKPFDPTQEKVLTFQSVGD